MSAGLTSDEIREKLREVMQPSIAAWARERGFNQSYVNKVMRGEREVTDMLAGTIGFTREVRFRPCKPDRDGA